MNVYNHRGMRVPGMIQDGGALPRMKIGGALKALKSISQKMGLNKTAPNPFRTKSGRKVIPLVEKVQSQQTKYFAKHGRHHKTVKPGKEKVVSGRYVNKVTGNKFSSVPKELRFLMENPTSTKIAKNLREQSKKVKQQAKHNRKVRTKRKKK